MRSFSMPTSQAAARLRTLDAVHFEPLQGAVEILLMLGRTLLLMPTVTSGLYRSPILPSGLCTASLFPHDHDTAAGVFPQGVPNERDNRINFVRRLLWR